MTKMIHPIVVDSAGGEYMESVLVVEWTRKPGDRIDAGETIVIVETAKAATEIEASHSGYLADIFFEAGQEAPVGALLGNLSDTFVNATAEQPGATADVAAPITAIDLQPVAETPKQVVNQRVIATPLARRLALQHGVDLAAVAGSGPRGRIKACDVEAVAAVARETATAIKPAPIAMLRPASGDGPGDLPATPIVLLHGFGADRNSWRLVAPLLDSRHRVVMPELPGHGDAAEIRVTGIEDIALAISDELQIMGIDEAHLVGHSLGGATALALSQIGRLRIRTLCLIAPGGLGPEIDGAFLNGLIRATQAESLMPWLDRMVADPATLPNGFARAILRQRERTNTQAAQLRLLEALFPDGIQSMRLRAALDEISVPTKVIWGLKDAVIPSSHALSAPGSVALHLLRGIGHVPQLECPELIARLIGELVRSNT
jgi:pyruvate dehydrogenase E2 component (dihydrolipoamide acetyltransferase)